MTPGGDSFRDRATAPLEGEGARVVEAAGLPVERIGPYRLIRLLGEGGFGAVYLAEQASPRRLVAVKVLKPGAVSRQSLARFEHEAQALARLKHAGIAQVVEAGTFDVGSGEVAAKSANGQTGTLANGRVAPFFAMEYVEGVPLTVHAEREGLRTRQRVGMMIKVCEAVQHAHNHGVIHRDLKPANILVDKEGQPKVLDFGVARVADDDMARVTSRTDVGQIIGTLAYMSPEQVEADPLKVDTRADVYALGVILFEILTGRLPYDVDRKLLHEATRTICESSPAKLGAVSRVYRGDLETIAGKALEKEKERRYASPAALADDLKRYLHDEPIEARAPSTVYQARKFAKRNKGLVAGLAGVMAALAAGAVVASVQALRAMKAEAEAKDEAATATALNGFLVNMFESIDPDRSQGREVTVRELLDEAAATVGDRFRERPRVEAVVRGTLGQTYQAIGKAKEAAGQYEAAAARYEEEYGPEDRNTIAAKRNWAGVLADGGEYAKAEELARETLGTLERVYGADDADTIRNMGELARVLQETTRLDEAETLMRSAIEKGKRVLGPDHETVLLLTHNLGTSLKDHGKLPEAEDLLREALVLREQKYGPRHSQTLYTVNNLATVLLRRGKNEEAEPLLRRAVEDRTAILGKEHPSTLVAMHNLATSLVPQRKLEEAEGIMGFVYATNLRDRGEEHPKTLIALGVLAYLNEDLGRSDEAEKLYLKAIQIRKRIKGGTDPETWPPMNNLATLYVKWGRLEEAEGMFREVIGLTTAALPPEHPFTAIFRSNFGECLTKLGKHEEAEEVLKAAYPVLVKQFGEKHDRTTKAAARLVELYEAWGRGAEAAEWRSRAGAAK